MCAFVALFVPSWMETEQEQDTNVDTVSLSLPLSLTLSLSLSVSLSQSFSSRGGQKKCEKEGGGEALVGGSRREKEQDGAGGERGM